MSGGLQIDKRAGAALVRARGGDLRCGGGAAKRGLPRMLDRLDYIRCQPATILDAGSGTGNALRFPARVVIRGAPDRARPCAGHARTPAARLPWWRRLLGRRALAVCGDIERLPLAPDAACRHGLVEPRAAVGQRPPRAFSEMRRVLVPGGLIMFSTFGPDTLKELRQACDGTDGRTHVNRFIDLHDIGDMLAAAALPTR
jgi:malonyl-CoA O-methyltransferase